MKDIIYQYEGEYPHGGAADLLVKACVIEWLRENGCLAEGELDPAGPAPKIDPENDIEEKEPEVISLEGLTAWDILQARIRRTPKGKPYFTALPIEFSVTNSGRRWMCLVSDRPCGLDLQLMHSIRKPEREVMLAKRFFRPAEAEAVSREGSSTFCRIWVRREAWAKLTGAGILGGEIPNVLEDQGTWDGRTWYFSDIDVGLDFRCAAVTARRSELPVRRLDEEAVRVLRIGTREVD